MSCEMEAPEGPVQRRSKQSEAAAAVGGSRGQLLRPFGVQSFKA